MAFLRKPPSGGSFRYQREYAPGSEFTGPSASTPTMGDVAAGVNIASKVLPVVTKLGFGTAAALKRRFADSPEQSARRQAAANIAGVELPPTIPIVEESVAVGDQTPPVVFGPSSAAPTNVAPKPPLAPPPKTDISSAFAVPPGAGEELVYEGMDYGVQAQPRRRATPEEVAAVGESLGLSEGMIGSLAEKTPSADEFLYTQDGRLVRVPKVTEITRDEVDLSVDPENLREVSERVANVGALAGLQQAGAGALGEPVPNLRLTEDNLLERVPEIPPEEQSLEQLVATIGEPERIGQGRPTGAPGKIDPGTLIPTGVRERRLALQRERDTGMPPGSGGDAMAQQAQQEMTFEEPLDVSIDKETPKVQTTPLLGAEDEMSFTDEESAAAERDFLLGERAEQIDELIESRIIPAMEAGGSGSDIAAELVKNGASPQEARAVVRRAMEKSAATLSPGASVPGVTRRATPEEVRSGKEGMVSLPAVQAAPPSIRAAATMAAAATTPEQKSRAIGMAMDSAEPEDFWDLMFGRHKLRAGLQVQKFFPVQKGLSPEELDLRNRQLASLERSRMERAKETTSKIAERAAKTRMYEHRVEKSKELATLDKDLLRARIAKLNSEVEKIIREQEWGGLGNQESLSWINRQVDGRRQTITAAMKLQQKELLKWQGHQARKTKITGNRKAEGERKARLKDAPERIKTLKESLAELQKADSRLEAYLGALMNARATGNKKAFEDTIRAGIDGDTAGDPKEPKEE